MEEIITGVLVSYGVDHETGLIDYKKLQEQAERERPAILVAGYSAYSRLIDFSIMGSSLYKSLFPEEKPKVALLNIGSEELKGNEVIKETYQKLNQIVNEGFEFKGFIEGNHIMDGNVNVIVADGFTGNVALKTAEGTANFITNELKEAMKSSVFGKLGSLISINSLKKFKKKLDPRL